MLMEIIARSCELGVLFSLTLVRAMGLLDPPQPRYPRARKTKPQTLAAVSPRGDTAGER